MAKRSPGMPKILSFLFRRAAWIEVPRIIVTLWLSTLFFCSVLAPFSAFAGKSISSGQFTVDQSKSDIIVQNSGAPPLSFRSIIADELTQNVKGTWPFASYEAHLQVISFIGPIISIADRRVYENPGTYNQVRIRTWDLTKINRAVLITDMFSDVSVRDKLLKIPEIRNLLKQKKINNPATAKELATVLTIATAGRHQGELFFPDGWLSNFFFNSVNGDRVVISLGIPKMTGMREESLTTITMTFPVPVLLKGALDKAVNKHEGLLCNCTVPAINDSYATTLVFNDFE